MFERPLGTEQIAGTQRQARINPLGNWMARPPEMAEETRLKPLRARLLTSKEHAIADYRIAWDVTDGVQEA